MLHNILYVLDATAYYYTVHRSIQGAARIIGLIPFSICLDIGRGI